MKKSSSNSNNDNLSTLFYGVAMRELNKQLSSSSSSTLSVFAARIDCFELPSNNFQFVAPSPFASLLYARRYTSTIWLQL